MKAAFAFVHKLHKVSLIEGKIKASLVYLTTPTALATLPHILINNVFITLLFFHR